jgi:SAM-dependent methyltransferase
MIAKVQRIAQTEGFSGLLKRVIDRYHFYTEPQPDAWDKRFNVETATIVPMSKLRVSANAEFASHYHPIGVERFEKMMAKLPIDHSQFTFIDLGSGKGKALMLAAAYPFKECIGVEFSAELAEIAEQNVLRYTGKTNCPIRTIVQDATQFQFPDEPLVVYLFNPFEIEILKPVIENLAHSKANPLYVAYLYPPSRFATNPKERGVLDSTFKLIAEADGLGIYSRCRRSRLRLRLSKQCFR